VPTSPLFTRPQLDAIRAELEKQVNGTSVELLMASFNAMTVNLIAVADAEVKEISYTKNKDGSVSTMVPDVQVGGLYSTVTAKDTGELAAHVSRHPKFQDSILTLKEVKTEL
jgi:hypothetical protein